MLTNIHILQENLVDFSIKYGEDSSSQILSQAPPWGSLSKLWSVHDFIQMNQSQQDKRFENNAYKGKKPINNASNIGNLGDSTGSSRF